MTGGGGAGGRAVIGGEAGAPYNNTTFVSVNYLGWCSFINRILISEYDWREGVGAGGRAVTGEVELGS